MGFLSRFEGKMEDTVEGAAELFGGSSISPVQIAKKAEKQMRRERVVGAGIQHAPTLYTVLVSPEDDARMYNYYPTLAGETETYLMAKAAELGYNMDGQPLVRFIIDDQLKRGKFDVVAEMVASHIITGLRNEEMSRYGIQTPNSPRNQNVGGGQGGLIPPNNMGAPSAAGAGMGAAGAGMRGAAGAVGAQGGYAYQQRPTAQPQYDEPYDAPYDAQFDENYDPEYDEINSANIAEPYLGNASPALQAHQAAFAQPQMAPQAAVQPAYDDEPSPTTIPFDGNGGMGAQTHEVYLYDEARDRAYQLTGVPQKIGRESSNDIVVPDINASRVHAEIRMDPSGSWIITDLGSMNGLYVNGRKIKTSPLRDADMITIGVTDLEFQLLE